MNMVDQPRASRGGFGGTVQASIPLILCIVGFGAGVYLGLALEMETILGSRRHPLLAAMLPTIALLAVALVAWRAGRFKLWLRPVALGAVLAAAIAGPTFLLGLRALANF